MKEDWDSAIDFVLEQEGGYTNDPNDSGGETVFGIARNENPNWEGWVIIDQLKTIPGYISSIDTNPGLLQSAKDFYQANYWLPCSCDDLPTSLAVSVFDCSVNQGVTKAKRLLQMALNVTVDGVIGSETITAAAKAGVHEVKMFLAQRLADYTRIIMQNPKNLIYAVNWSFRVLSLSQLVL